MGAPTTFAAPATVIGMFAACAAFAGVIARARPPSAPASPVARRARAAAGDERERAAPGGRDRRRGSKWVVAGGVFDAVLVDVLERRSELHLGVALHVAIEPGDRRLRGPVLVARVGQAHAVAAAHPEHRGGNARRAQDAEVGDGFFEWEQRVDRALLEQRRRGDPADEVARTALHEPSPVGRADHAGRVAVVVRARDLRVDGMTLATL